MQYSNDLKTVTSAKIRDGEEAAAIDEIGNVGHKTEFKCTFTSQSRGD
jgi:hypothetical protein